MSLTPGSSAPANRAGLVISISLCLVTFRRARRQKKGRLPNALLMGNHALLLMVIVLIMIVAGARQYARQRGTCE